MLTPTEQANVDLVRQFLAAPHRDIGLFRAAHHRVQRAAFCHLPTISGITPEQVARAVNHQTEPGLSDRQDSIERITAAGDTVWVQWTVRGKHTGTLFGLPPTGKRIELVEVSIFRIVDGKVAESWFIADELGLLLQLGVEPAQIRAALG